jgi:hypothetical protein
LGGKRLDLDGIAKMLNHRRNASPSQFRYVAAGIGWIAAPITTPVGDLKRNWPHHVALPAEKVRDP